MTDGPTNETSEVVREVAGLLEQSKLEEAVERANLALQRGIEAPLLLNLRAYWLEGRKRVPEALADLQRASALAPDDAMVLNALGLCLSKLGRLQEGLDAFRKCVALAPEFGPGHFNCGWAFEEAGEFDSARRSFEEAARLDPAAAAPLGRLADLAARRSQWKSARQHGEKALLLDPGQAAATIALAKADLAEKAYAAGEKRLCALIDTERPNGQDRATAMGLLGDFLDAQGRYSEAFTAYSAGNALFKTIFAERPAAQTEMPMSEYARWLLASFDTAKMPPWTVEANDASRLRTGPKRHLFVLGFPRSGTTLVEEVLACHPEVTTTGERDALAAIARELLAAPAHLERLRVLDAADTERYRQRYWDALGAFGIPVEDRILVDKQPFNTVRLPLIARLFPEAKIVFCLRDPRDVVLSCFRRRFALNSANVEFLSLEGTARLYDAVMKLAVVYRSKLPLNVHEIRNEALVADFDAQMRALCAFAAIDWVDEFRNFARRSSERQIVTPSAPQILRGLDREGIGHWRNYGPQMAPVLPLLDGWADRLDYGRA